MLGQVEQKSGAHGANLGQRLKTNGKFKGFFIFSFSQR